jgi:hypothetical protein
MEFYSRYSLPHTIQDSYGFWPYPSGPSQPSIPSSLGHFYKICILWLSSLATITMLECLRIYHYLVICAVFGKINDLSSFFLSIHPDIHNQIQSGIHGFLFIQIFRTTNNLGSMDFYSPRYLQPQTIWDSWSLFTQIFTTTHNLVFIELYSCGYSQAHNLGFMDFYSPRYSQPYTS